VENCNTGVDDRFIIFHGHANVPTPAITMGLSATRRLNRSLNELSGDFGSSSSATSDSNRMPQILVSPA
jgi:hypothetical protein